MRTDTLEPETVEHLLNVMSNALNGRFFRDRDLFLEVLDDQLTAVRCPSLHRINAAFIVLTPKGDELRITSTTNLGAITEAIGRGVAVYTPEQFLELVTELNHAPAREPDMTP